MGIEPCWQMNFHLNKIIHQIAREPCPHHHRDANQQNTIEILLESKQLTTILPDLPVPPEAFTFPSGNPARVIDWIFVSEPWQIEEQKVVSTDLSDHLPVMARLTRKLSDH